jgi:hypothetical protein
MLKAAKATRANHQWRGRMSQNIHRLLCHHSHPIMNAPYARASSAFVIKTAKSCPMGITGRCRALAIKVQNY